jgi:hypothetical protein
MALKFLIIPPSPPIPASYVNVPYMMPMLQTFGNSKLNINQLDVEWGCIGFQQPL